MSSEEECLICFESIDVDTELILDCEHKFHENCITEWYQISTQKDCPICRKVITSININEDNVNDNNNNLNELVFNWQRKWLLLIIPSDMILSIVSSIYSINIISSITSIILDFISYIGTYKYDVNTLYGYLLIWFCKHIAFVIYYTYQLYVKNDFIINNNLVINHLPLFLTSEFIGLYIFIMVNILIFKLNTYRREYLNNV